MSPINKTGAANIVSQASIDPPKDAPKTTTLNVSTVPVQASPSERLSKTMELSQTNAQIKAKVTTAYSKQNNAANGVGNVDDAANAPMARALRLVDVRGTADEHDKMLVAKELTKLPPDILQRLEKNGTRVTVCRNSITEVLTKLKGVTPRGWKSDQTWDSVPGQFNPESNRVIIATRGHNTPEGAHVPRTGDGHGSYNVVIHETMHGIDYRSASTKLSTSPNFTKARKADLATLDPYETQEKNAGPEETFAESAARYYGGDVNDAAKHPNLHSYWATNPLDSKNPRP